MPNDFLEQCARALWAASPAMRELGWHVCRDACLDMASAVFAKASAIGPSFDMLTAAIDTPAALTASERIPLEFRAMCAAVK